MIHAAPEICRDGGARFLITLVFDELHSESFRIALATPSNIHGDGLVRPEFRPIAYRTDLIDQ
ncbi:hypothetical protein [Burkholderia sp. JP2-270]|uniref:hypothetical protein n=1 Tax=Burkholderia sp. JP2-270 TaxID=2217913 RepID=UPI0013A69B37|nr:hypothetical protein [Burkholderia sp. JP2-270]